ncbi:putative phage tail protein [Paenibacillus oleatilyticus]|uniref:putative phage tail protein n=1 Tax=Paenibacillus oleatilyticus TaxID=2594886 RepID=UPI001C1FE2EB|nr:putative phage tail protein [Paenibacillus oleatilyticus]MBU7314043.1 YmfQ family protein [Paenibacillus oleatilyticus]
MNFSSFLMSFFPHRWLNPKHPGNKKLFEGLGKTLDQMNNLLQQVKNESRVLTAVDTIPLREDEYGIPSDPSIPLDIRRSSIIARMREQARPITKEDLLNALRSYGLEAEITTIPGQSIMKIRIISPYGEPPGFKQIQEFVEEVTRAHVGKEWIFSYTTWGEVKRTTWADVKQGTWEQLKTRRF